MTDRAVGSDKTLGSDDYRRIVVPPTTRGVATALSYVSAGLPHGADRSDPQARPQPPLFRSGDRLFVPPQIRAAATDSDVTMVVPDDLAHLYVAAPLAYYLGARVTVSADSPRLEVGGHTERFSRLPAFQHEVAGVLRHVLLLDCLARDPSLDPGLVDDIWFSLPELATVPTTERLRRYFEVPRDVIHSHRPRWHLAAYVEPTFDHVAELPHLLGDLALVYLPRAEPLDEQGVLACALDDFFRSGRPGRIASVDMVAPELQDADLHGWLAGGVPIDAFTPSLSAYEHRLDWSDTDDELDVAVVLNDTTMVDEHAAVERIYREADRKIGVTVHEELGTDDLARTFEETRDFVHFIGHCEVEGLRCHDGHLDVASLSSVSPRTFFLNACGSYYQGRELIERGAVAGGVTLRGVLNRPAVTVGTMFARLLVAGFGIDRAMALARRQITMSTDYTVVGDGSYSLDYQGAEALARVDHSVEGYRLTYEVPATRRAGGSYHDPITDRTRLRGRSVTTVATASTIADTLDRLDCPVVFDGELTWSAAVARTLDAES